MASDNARIILIAGPTASGKSGLALALARELGGVVVNADSMQVYRELRLLTARPSAEDEGTVPHRLYGHVAAAEAYSVARWLADLGAVLDQLRRADRAAIIVGGTGLYFKALTEGLSEVPPIPDEIRRHWRAEAERIGAAALHAALTARDPAMAARLDPRDPQRIVRALEVMEATGRSLADWQADRPTPLVDVRRARALVIVPDREALRGRCDARFDGMMAAGALEEVAALRSLGLSPELPAMRALGVAPLIEHLAGRQTRDEAVERAKSETRQYAKRQATWFRHQLGEGWQAVATADEGCAAFQATGSKLAQN